MKKSDIHLFWTIIGIVGTICIVLSGLDIVKKALYHEILDKDDIYMIVVAFIVWTLESALMTFKEYSKHLQSKEIKTHE